LERIRAAQAARLERRNAIEQSRLIDVDILTPLFEGIFRTFGMEFEAIERIHGPAVGDGIRQALARTDKAVRAQIKELEAAAAPPPPKENRLGHVAASGEDRDRRSK
jgi:hypothetical protein